MELPRTAMDAYTRQGAGIGAGALAFDWLHESGFDGKWGSILEVGCGACDFVRRAKALPDTKRVIAVDAAWASVQTALKAGVSAIHLDVSHDQLPLETNGYDLVSCTETLEHVANPYHALAEIKRVLKPDALFVLSFPMPEVCDGYGPWQHSFVYPGLFANAALEKFMRQLYFAELVRGTANNYIGWRIYANYKGVGMQDIFEVMASDRDEEGLYGMLPSYAEHILESYDGGA